MNDSTAISHDAAAKLDMAELRRVMVDCQLRTYDVTDKAVLAAMGAVPREDFVPASKSFLAYLDKPVTIGTGENGLSRALMTPMVLARMLQALAIKPGESVLDYAVGTGYSAAVISQMGAKTVAVERVATLREAAKLALARGGYDDVTVKSTLNAQQPVFDAVLVNGACEVQPERLLQLLGPNGRLICVMGAGRAASVMLYQRSGDAIGSRMIFDAAAPMLYEFRRPAEFKF